MLCRHFLFGTNGEIPAGLPEAHIQIAGVGSDRPLFRALAKAVAILAGQVILDKFHFFSVQRFVHGQRRNAHELFVHFLYRHRDGFHFVLYAVVFMVICHEAIFEFVLVGGKFKGEKLVDLMLVMHGLMC